MKYVSVDLETTCLNADKGQILELAMVLEDTEKPLVPIAELQYYRAIVGTKHTHFTGDAFALALNHKLLSDIAQGHGVDPMRVETEADSWLALHLPPGPVFMAAKNGAGFDLVWLKRHMPALACRFSHRVIDPGSVLIDWKTGPVSLGKLLGGEAKHEALEDARDNIRALRRSYT